MQHGQDLQQQQQSPQQHQQQQLIQPELVASSSSIKAVYAPSGKASSSSDVNKVAALQSTEPGLIGKTPVTDLQLAEATDVCVKQRQLTQPRDLDSMQVAAQQPNTQLVNAGQDYQQVTKPEMSTAKPGPLQQLNVQVATAEDEPAPLSSSQAPKSQQVTVQQSGSQLIRRQAASSQSGRGQPLQVLTQKERIANLRSALLARKPVRILSDQPDATDSHRAQLKECWEFVQGIAARQETQYDSLAAYHLKHQQMQQQSKRHMELQKQRDPQSPFATLGSWLILMRHNTNCAVTNGQCAFGLSCVMVRELAGHLQQCRKEDCLYPR